MTEEPEVEALRRRVAALEDQLRLANIDNANTEAELAQARAGESEQSGEPRPAVAWTPAEWIHWWNRSPVAERLATVERIYEASRFMSDCIGGRHEQRIAELTEGQEKLLSDQDRLTRAEPLTVRFHAALVDGRTFTTDRTAPTSRSQP